MRKKLLFLILILSSILPASADNFIINESTDTVYMEDSHAKIGVSPVTLSSSGYSDIIINSKTYTGDIDLCLGFSDTTLPRKAEYYNPHYVNWETTSSHVFENVVYISTTSEPITIGSEDADFKRAVTTQSIIDNETVSTTVVIGFDSYFEDEINNTYTAFYQVPHTKLVEWTDVTRAFSPTSFNYGNYNKWYQVEDFGVTAGEEYKLRIWLDLPVSLEEVSGKYLVAIKPSFQTYSQAYSADTLYLLDPWYNSSWDTCFPITINNSKVVADQSNFPVYLNFTSTILRDTAQADGDDIIFMSADNSTVYAHEFEGSYDSATGHLRAFVNVTELSSTEDTVIWCYCGNPNAANQQDPEGVWPAAYKAVWHLDETGTGNFTIYDSTSNDNDGINYGATPIDSGIDSGLSFDGVDDYIDIISGVSDFTIAADEDFTVLCVFKRNTAIVENPRLFGVGDSQSTQGYRVGISGSTGRFVAQTRGSTSMYSYGTHDMTDSDYHTCYYVLDRASSSISLYSDTTLDDFDDITGMGSITPTIDFTIGAYTYIGSTNYFDDTITEVWFIKDSLSNGTIETLYNTLLSPSTFATVGTSENTLPSTPTIPSIIDGFNNVTISDASIDGHEFEQTCTIVTTVSTDADGGDVDHNLSLWYADNSTHITTLATFTDADATGTYYNVSFDTVPYYLDGVNYTLTLTAIDDESVQVNATFPYNFLLYRNYYNVSGYVFDDDTPANPIEGATVTFTNHTTVTSNATGYYSVLAFYNGTYNVETQAYGYYTNDTSLTVDGSDPTLNITMEANEELYQAYMPWQAYLLLLVLLVGMIFYSFTVIDNAYYTDIITSLVSCVLAFILAHTSIIGIGYSYALYNTVEHEHYSIIPLGIILGVIGIIMLIFFIIKILELAHQEVEEFDI